MTNKNSVIEESVLKTALRLLQDGSYRTTNVTAICRQAGVSRSSFYRCFVNKEDVLSRLLKQEFFRHGTDAEGGDPEYPEAFRRIFICKTESHRTENHFPEDHSPENHPAEHPLVEEQNPEKTSPLQRWFHSMLSTDTVLDLFYTNGYGELVRRQMIELYAGPPVNEEFYYRRVFEAGGILSLYETWKQPFLNH